jgi:hypothetical protein
MKDEMNSFADRLYEAIQDYAAAKGQPISYDGNSYPYWYAATGGSYKGWDAELMKSTFNYQMYQKEPGNWAHNFRYMMQLLYDSIEDMGGDVTGLTRPTNL